jgi:hypothetical protein
MLTANIYPRTARRWRMIVGTCALLAGARAFAQDNSPVAIATQAHAFLSDGKAGQAIALLKQELERAPLDKSLRLLLARAYLDDGNQFWAVRTLNAAAEVFPEDCNIGLWQAWIQLRQGELEQARDRLSTACAAWAPDQGRRALLSAMLEQQAGSQPAAQANLDRAAAERFAYPEDRAAIARLRNTVDPGFIPPLSGRLDLAAGFTGNALAGSPVDPTTQANGASSPLLAASAFLRLVSPRRSWARPAVDVEARGLGFSAPVGRDLSYLMLDARPEVMVGGAGPHAILAYRYESLLLAGGDRYGKGPIWFFEAHRGEWEMEILRVLTVFGGAGRRNFREQGRTRFELDGGIGAALPMGSRLHLVAALAGRYHDAKNDAWSLYGGSLLASAEVRLPRRWSLRAGMLASTDRFPHSAGYFDAAAPSKNRRDILVKLSASAFAPPLAQGVKLGLTYEFSKRDSTASPYSYDDHRILAKAIWSFASDPWLPHEATPVGHVPLDYHLADAETGERVQDLLRQDEAAQRSSSCRE